MKRAEDLMTRPVFVCNLDDSADQAATQMWDHDCGAVPVVDDSGRLWGIVTDRDLCMAAHRRKVPLTEIPVRTMMTRDVCTCRPSDSLATVELLMSGRQVRRIPVVDSRGHPIGIVSLNDLARAIARNGASSGKAETPDGVARTLAAVCEPRMPLRSGTRQPEA